MIPFELEVTFPAGAVLVGGYSAVPRWLDAVHASDQRGRPILPATALRGALRESLEAILRGADLPACQGGTGQEPGLPTSGATRCVLDGGAACRACRLFGLQRENIEQGERFFSALILGEAVLPEGVELEWSHVHNVAISRSHRSAEDKRLFNRRVPRLGAHGFIARGRLLDPSLRRELEAAVRATTHLGSGRSRGLARIDLALRWLEAPAEPTQAKPGEQSEVWVRLTLRSPAVLGAPAGDNNLRDSRAEIPGATLRGAVGFALARVLPDPDNDPLFAQFVDEDKGASFGFLYPSDNRTEQGNLAAPWPITAKACKAKPRQHPVVDTLFDRLRAAVAKTPAEAVAIQAGERSVCSDCKQPLRGAKGTRGSAHGVATRLVTRVALDRHTNSASDGKLFSQVLVEAGATFEGPIRRIPSGTSSLLALAAGGPIYVGRGTSAGQGEARLELLSSPKRPSLQERGKKFLYQLNRSFREVGLATNHTDRWVPLTLLSPLLAEEGDDGTVTLAKALGTEPARWVLKARRFSREGGWDQRKGKLFADLAVMAGAVFVVELPGPWEAHLRALQELEQRGAGRRTHQGFGYVCCFDPFITEGERK